MVRKLFTSEEIKTLRNNPYTSRVSSKSIRFTLAFKEAFWSGYQAGRAPSQLIRELGYDPEMLGPIRIDGIVKHIKAEANSESGLHESYALRPRRHIQESDIDASAPHQAMKRMQNEIIYLR